ncbi:MAG: tRNA-dihydrouridine synthase [candidate division TM6 bacterium GW2011_GWF2_28_16]|nr:MAG: tRNA-dihydrouridine synthase [candidate division TM6 bacterium GW2011_GWF2_28_16]
MNKKFWHEKILFNNLKVPRFMSAPIDGYLDSPARQLMRMFSKEELLFGQMRHAATVSNCLDLDEFKIQKIEHPFCFQVSANSTNFIEEAIEKILEQNFAMLNLNSGCPAKNIINSGSGCALMAKPELLEQIIKIIINKVNNKIPVTLKIRAGFKEKNALELSQMAEYLGISGIIIHPRLKDQGFIGDLDFELVKKIKEAVKIPVIFSGNLIDANSVKYAYEHTGADGFMIGRALFGAPWKMQEILYELDNKKFNITEKEKIEIAILNLELNSKYYGPKYGFNALKKHLGFYIKHMTQASKIRMHLMLAKDEIEMKNILVNLKESL